MVRKGRSSFHTIKRWSGRRAAGRSPMRFAVVPRIIGPTRRQIHERGTSPMNVLSADVVIVGSGVAGALTGFSLARTGARVLILEAGPRVDRGKALASFRESPSEGPNSPYPADPAVAQPESYEIDAYYVQAERGQ